MTSLAKQLQRLAVPHSQAVFGGDKRKVSLLFDPKEAASIDRETFYALGTNGLEELITLYEGFQEYEGSLYAESSLTFERSVQTKEVNQKLDETINRFLIHLSPYCLLKPAHKALEWLIYRYHIHHYNMDDLILCFLPYHESRIFIRVIQLFRFDSKTGTKWDWLQPMQSSGVHLSSITLRNHCRTNPAFLNFICDMVSKSLKVYDTAKSQIPQLKVLFSFYTTTIIGVLELNNVTETLVSLLLPLLSNGLRSHILDYRVASYMILSQLLHKTKLKWSLLKTLQQVLCKFASGELLEETVMCLLLMFQTQTDVQLTRKSFKYLLRQSALVDIVSQLSLEYPCDALIWELLEHLVPAAFKESFSLATSEESSGSEFEGSLPQYLSVLHRILAGVTLTPALAEKTAIKFIQGYVKYINKCTDKEENDKMKSSLRRIVRLLEGRYSLCVDSAVKRIMSELEEEADRSLVQQFLNMSVLSVQHHLMAESDASLALSLNHRLPEVRQKAVEHLLQNNTEIDDEEFLQESILLRLQDDWPQVVNAILKNGKNFWHLVTHQELALTHLGKLFKKAVYDKSWHETAKLALTVLGMYECNGEVAMRIVDIVLPYCFMVFADTFYLEFMDDVCKLPQINNSTFLSHFVQDWKSYSPVAARIGDINLKVAECIAMAAENCGPSDCLHMVEKWCQKSYDTEEPQFQCLLILVVSNLIRGSSVGKRTSQSIKFSRMEYSWILLQMITKILKENKMDQNLPRKVPGNLVAIEMSQLVTEACSYIQIYRKVPHFLCLRALQGVIENLKVPGTLETAPWWQYMGDGGPEDKFLQVSVCLFAFLMNGASDAKDTVNRVLLHRFFKECLQDVHIVMKFLCLLWTQDCNDQHGHLGFTTALQAQALQLGLVYLRNLGNGDIVSVASSATVVISLVLVLTSPYQGIRECGVHAVQALLTGQGDTEGSFSPLMRKIVYCSEEIASDNDYIQEVMKSVYKNTSLEGESSPKKSRNQKTQKKDLKRESLKSFIRELTSKTSPVFLQHRLLHIFRKLDSTEMLTGLLPLLKSILNHPPGEITPVAADSLKLLVERFTHQNISTLGPDSQGLKLFLKILCLPSKQSWHPVTPQIAAIKQVTKELFSALEHSAQQKILMCLFDVWVEGTSITVTNLIRKVLKHIPMEAEHIAEELKSCLKTAEAKSMKQAKRLRRDLVEEQANVELSEFENLEWQRKTVVLEAVHLKKRIQNYHVLVPVTFQVLARILESESHMSAEYQKQLILSLLCNLCMRLEKELVLEGKTSVGSDKFNMELIVNCIRTSENPQTHQQALLVLTAAAKIYPEHLLHNVMSVFTFIGANILRQDDAYSFHVISRILETVIPALITACEQRKRVPKDITNNVEDVITMVIQVFVDAYPHIPGHRRQMLFTQLLKVVGGGSYLWRTLLLIMEMVVTKGMPRSGVTAEEESSAVLPSQDLEFCLSQCSQFSSSVQITSAVNMLKYISKLPNDKEDGKSSQKITPKSLGKLRRDEAHIFSVETHTARQLRHFKYATVCLLVAMFSGEEFISQMVSTEERELLDSARKILETTLEFICQVSMATTAAGASQGHKATIRFLKALQHKSYDLLDKVVSLFPERIFIEVVSSLVSHPLASICRKALDMLNVKLQAQREEIDKQKEKLFLPLVDRLVTLIQESVWGTNITEESLINGQTAFISLKLLCKILGDKHPPTFIQVLKVSVQVFTGHYDNQQVSACALLCLAEICSTLKVHVIQHLPLFMPQLLNILSKEEALFSNELYLLSVLTTVSKVTENLAHFLSPYLTDILFHECVLLGKGAEVEVLNKPHLQLRLKAIRQSLATLLPSRVLLPAILTCYERLLQERLVCVSALLQLLDDHIHHINKEDLTHHLTSLQTFFFACLDLRGQEQNQVSKHTIEAIEGVAIETIITMVMKLSEATFRPFLFKLFDWVTRDDEQRHRILVFYRLADRLADSLRSLFTLFAGHIFQHAASMLTQNCKAKSGTKFFPEDRKKRKKSCQLLLYILDCLHKCFLYDTEGFVSKERFDSIMQPLVDQIENEQGSEEMYHSRISEHLVPCIVQFAVAAQDDSLWKALNYQILLKTRNSAARVRFAALMAIDELHKKLGEDYMTLLPETIPFLAELMEDESEEVEKKCQAVVVQMEKTLGEPLQKYF
ncbi:hypothetical protein CHS0354_042081 [Potamilus streckersoni]|uniref:HEAT repeat-containing protein 1 n=1 Tax=Potamilus streckersoni TaxID=2493646 RepID=A0AAE0TLU6_9BIVA|nr:hypothetical protein CHS0354_042081 [Potamilus streckersoni]